MKWMQRTLLAIAIVTNLCAGALNQGDRKVLLDHLNQSASDFRDSIKGLSSEQWNYKPSADVLST